MIVKEKIKTYQAEQWDGECKTIGKALTVVAAPLGMRVCGTDNVGYLIEKDMWVLHDDNGKIINVLSDKDFQAKYEATEILQDSDSVLSLLR